MTFDDDFVRLNFITGVANFPLKNVGLEWPPPERVFVEPLGFLREPTPDDDPTYLMRRVSFSQITDEQRATMTHVCRGAEYRYESEALERVLP